jgi:hypothetical protein
MRLVFVGKQKVKGRSYIHNLTQETKFQTFFAPGGDVEKDLFNMADVRVSHAKEGDASLPY